MENIIKLGGRRIGRGRAPYLIAEMSGNHNQSLDRALQLVDAAADSGAHAIKLQTYTPDTMTLNIDSGDFKISDPNSLWSGRSLYDLYQEAHTPWEWHSPIFDKARERGIVPFSTPFDSTAVDFLEDLNVAFYKIASFENTDLPLVSKVASTGKPVIISTGMASIAQLDETVQTARDAGCKDLILLKCTSTYPANPENTNILTIPHMRELFKCEVGLSDHTRGIGVSVASTALGASVIEKHFTLDRLDGGVDSVFSMEPSEFRQLRDETESAHKALGQVSYGVEESEKDSVQFRRSLYIVKDLKQGDLLSEENVRAIRPGFGIESKNMALMLGRAIKRDLKKGTALTWDLV